MHEHRLTLRAPADQTLHLWIEPWAQGLAFPPGSLVELWASSDIPGELDTAVSAGATAVYGGPGSTLKVFLNGEALTSFDIPVPGGLNRENVTFLFGTPPVPTAEEQAFSRDAFVGLLPNQSMPEDRCFRISELDLAELRHHTGDQKLIALFSNWIQFFAPRIDGVISQITAAFSDMKLGDGIGLFEANGLEAVSKPS